MHRLVAHAKDAIGEWTSDAPRTLASSVALLCRQVIDDGGLPQCGRDWLRLRQSFDVVPGQSIASSIVEWDTLCRLGEFGVSEDEAFVKLGIVTWTVKMLLKHLGMLSGPSALKQELDEWKAQLIHFLETTCSLEQREPKDSAL